MSHQALYRKWRPITFDDVVGQEHITAALKNQISSGRLSHAYLFTGTRGTGKTTCAKILARATNCLSPIDGNPCNQCESCRAVLADSAVDVVEIDAASNNGVDNIREIREEVNYSPAALKMRTYIIDEVHMLSTGAFNALLKTLEEPPEHVLFILATTEIHKVPATILSRCQRYDFRRIAPGTIAQRLQFIAQEEGLALEQDASLLLARLGDGSMRDALSLLDRCVAGDAPIDMPRVNQCLGIAENAQIMALFTAICQGDSAAALTQFYECYQQGRDLISLFDELLSLLRDIYIVQSVPDPASVLENSYFTLSELQQASALAAGSFLEFGVGVIEETLSRLTRSAIRRADGEMCLLRLCRGPQAPAAAPLPVVPQAPTFAAPPVAAPATPVAEPPPWEDAPSPTPVTPAPQPPVPEKPADVPLGGDAQLRDRYFAALKGTPMNPAAATYIRLAEYSAQGSNLIISVDEEALLLLDRPRVLAPLEEAAQKCGLSSIKLRAKGESAPAPSSGLDEILSSAHNLGIPVTEK